MSLAVSTRLLAAAIIASLLLRLGVDGDDAADDGDGDAALLDASLVAPLDADAAESDVVADARRPIRNIVSCFNCC